MALTLKTLSDFLYGAARVIEVLEDDDLRAQFEDRVKRLGRQAALTWLDRLKAEGVVAPETIERVRQEIESRGGTDGGQ